jgi:hypothetical protein
VLAGEVTMTVKVSSFVLVSKFGQPAVPGEGHIHYFLDVPAGAVSENPATVAAPPKDVGTYVPSVETSHTWKDVSPGPHIFAALLVDNDHTPLDDVSFSDVAVQSRVTVQ